MESSQQYNGISVQVRQGYGWAGGGPLEDRWKKKLDDDWRQNSNEQPAAKYASGTLKSAAKEKTEDAHSDIQFQRLRTLSQIAPISIVAHLPYDGDDPGSPVGKTLPVFLRNLERMRLNYKWSGSVLVVTYHTWIRIESEEEKTPWSVVKRLRESCANNSGHVLSINDLCDAASVLTPIQLQKMAQSEQWYFDCWPNMQDVLRFQPLLTALNRNPSLFAEALSEKGVATSVLPAVARRLLENPPIRGARLYIRYIQQDAETSSLQFSVADKQGAIINNFGIFLKPWVPDPGKRVSVAE